MKSLVYGCGRMLRFTLQKFDVDFSCIDFTDSNSELWNTEYIGGKFILPNIEIIPSNYDFCIIGSKNYSNEILADAKKIGFSDNQIIPFDYINSMWERWKKDIVHNMWRNTVEGNGVSVIRNWHMNGTEAMCILKLSDLCLYDIEVRVFDLYEDSREIEVYDISRNMLVGVFDTKKSIHFVDSFGDMVLKIVVKNAIIGIPWLMLSYRKTDLLYRIDARKLGKQFIRVYNKLQSFPYYDEDYTAIANMCDVNGTILDVGANYGQSMYAFYNLTKCNIVSIEVVPDLYDVLVMMKMLIDKENRISIINSGVSDKEKSITWYEPENPLMAGSFDENFIKGRKLGIDIIEKVMTCRSLDELVAHYDDIWFIKIDVEGLEYDTLKGAKNIIEHNHPVILIEQNEKLSEIKELLKDEYDVFYYNIYEDKFVEKRLSRLNCWLIPKEGYRSNTVKKLIDGKM